MQPDRRRAGRGHGRGAGHRLASRQGTIKEDTAIGILFAAALALGVALISSIRTYAVDLSHILFGNVLGVSKGDLWLTAGVGLLVFTVMVLSYSPFLVISFDPVLAATLRLPGRVLAHAAADPAGADHRGLAADGGRGAGGGDAGDARRRRPIC